jgi:hypothetical protein
VHEEQSLSYIDNLSAGAGAAFAFGDAWALYRSISHIISKPGSRPSRSQLISQALYLFDETRRYFLARVYKQMKIDAEDAAYALAAATDEERMARWKERLTEQHWMLEHNVDDAFERVVRRVEPDSALQNHL